MSEPTSKARIRWAPLLAAALALLFALLLSGCGPVNPNQWQTMGPTGNANVVSLAVDPYTPQPIYAGATGGVYVTRSDAGTALVPTTGGLPAGALLDVVLPNPHTQGTVYVGTNQGLYVSDHYGDSWHARGTGFPGGDAMAALIFGGDASTLLAGSVEHGVYVSHDLGATWQPANTGLPAHANINALLRDPDTGDVFAAVDKSGLYASGDGGMTWKLRATGIPSSTNVLALARLAAGSVAGHAGPTLYAGTSAGLYASQDAGEHWTALADPETQGQVQALATDPTHPDWLYAGITRPEAASAAPVVVQTQDGGQHWSSVASGLNRSVAALLAVKNPKGGASLLYAAEGQLARFPPAAARQPGLGDYIAQGLFLLVFVVLAFWLFRRSRRLAYHYRYGGSRTTAQPGTSGASPIPDSSGSQPAETAPDTAAHNGHQPLPPRPFAPHARRPRPQPQPQPQPQPHPEDDSGN